MEKVGGGILLTDEERQAKLDSLLAHRFTKRGELQLPTTSQYNSLAASDGLLAVAREMCRWLGVKPNGLHAEYSNQTADFHYSDNHILINTRYQNHPYATGGLLALAVISYICQRYGAETADQTFLEYATVYSGLGLWVLNALPPSHSRRQRLYHAVDGRWFHNEGIALVLYTPSQYANLVANFAHTNRLAPATYIRHISKYARHWLPRLTLTQSNQHLPDPQIVARHSRAANVLWLKILLVTVIFALLTTIAIYAVAQRRPTTDPRQVQAAQQLDVIKSSYDTCIKKVVEQQSTYDPNDIFMTRQIEATETRCESLRNQYNYAVDEYQQAYKSAGE